MDFKRCTLILLALLLLVSNVGLAVNVHYCGDNIISLSLKPIVAQSNEASCCDKLVLKKDSCCKDEVVSFQKKSDVAISKAIASYSYILACFNASAAVTKFVASNVTSTEAISYFCDGNDPPLFKLYNQYIFYA